MLQPLRVAWALLLSAPAYAVGFPQPTPFPKRIRVFELTSDVPLLVVPFEAALNGADEIQSQFIFNKTGEVPFDTESDEAYSQHTTLRNPSLRPTGAVLRKRDSSCADGYDSCSAVMDGSGLCCTSTAACSVDQSGNIGCCPHGAACTGLVSTSSASGSTTPSTSPSSTPGNSVVTVTNTPTISASQTTFTAGQTIFAAGAARSCAVAFGGTFKAIAAIFDLIFSFSGTGAQILLFEVARC